MTKIDVRLTRSAARELRHAVSSGGVVRIEPTQGDERPLVYVLRLLPHPSDGDVSTVVDGVPIAVDRWNLAFVHGLVIDHERRAKRFSVARAGPSCLCNAGRLN